MKYRIAHAVTHAVAVAIAVVHQVATAVEIKVWKGLTAAQDAAYDHGIAAEQAIVNTAQADLAAARRYLESANQRAQAVLRSLPEKIETVRQKVYE